MQNSKIIMSEINNLSEYLLEIEKSKKNERNFELSSNSKIIQEYDNISKKNILIFPENSKIYYNLKNNQIENIDIKYSTGCELKGIIKKSEKKNFGKIKKGKFIFSDKNYFLFERQNLKLIKLELYDKNGIFLGKLKNFPYTFSDYENPLKKKIIDEFFIYEVQTDNDGNYTKGTCYTNLGIFYTNFNFQDMKKKYENFFNIFGEVIPGERKSFLDVKTLGFSLRCFMENKKLLIFKKKGLKGQFYFYVENIDDFENGVGFYKKNDFIKKICFIKKNGEIFFCVNYRFLIWRKFVIF